MLPYTARHITNLVKRVALGMGFLSATMVCAPVVASAHSSMDNSADLGNHDHGSSHNHDHGSSHNIAALWQSRDTLAISLSQSGLLAIDHEDAHHDHHNTAGIGGDAVVDEISLLVEDDLLAEKIEELSEKVQVREDKLSQLAESITEQAQPEQNRHILAVQPVANAKVTSNYGYRTIFGRSQFHKGIDLAAKYGTPVYATGDGVVTYAGWVRGYGRFVKIQHEDGYETRYAHNSQLHVSVGDRISQNQHISDIGCSGRCTGPHLHYEVRKDGKPTNPNIYLAMAPER